MVPTAGPQSSSRGARRKLTDKNGLVHPISQQPLHPFRGKFYYRPAMNFIISLGLGVANPGGGNRLDDTRVYNKHGWNWSIGFDFAF